MLNLVRTCFLQTLVMFTFSANAGGLPEVNAPATEVNAPATEATAPAVVVNVPAPVVNVAAPRVNVPAPVVNVAAPEVHIPPPVVMQAPEAAQKPREVAACCDCNAPYMAIAITLASFHVCEGTCSDYPVSYRVQVPETDSRVRHIDRTLVSSGDARTGKLAGCGCSSGSCMTKEAK